MKPILSTWAAYWIRGALTLIVAFGLFVFLKSSLPPIQGLFVGMETVSVSLVALLLVPALVGMLNRKVIHPALRNWQALGGFVRWEDQIVKELSPDDEHGVSVVIVPWPSQTVRTLGLLSDTFQESENGPKLASVFIPNTPNPRTGFLRVVRMDDLVVTDWTFRDLTTFQLSYGSTASELLVAD